jgi:hypothetical protein
VEGPKGWNCAGSFYDAKDGCDCGCGLVDPDCESAAPEACEFCDNEGACLDGLCEDVLDQLDPSDNSQCV